MNIYSKYQLKDETENPFEINDGNDSITLNEKKKRDISKIDFAEDSKEIKKRFIYFLKKSFIETFRFPEDITGWTRYLTLFTLFIFFLYPNPALNLFLLIIAEPAFFYKALYRKNPRWTIIGWGVQILLTILYLVKTLLWNGFYNTFMVAVTGTLHGLLIIMYFMCILYCLKHEKEIEIQNQIRKAENDEIRKIANKASEDEFNRRMKQKYFSQRDYSNVTHYSDTDNTECLSDINEDYLNRQQKSDIKYFNADSIASTNNDPDSIDVPDISSLEHI